MSSKDLILTKRMFVKQTTDNDPVAQARTLALCEKDVIFFVNHFCWCFEPRAENGGPFPIVLWDYQRWALREWVQIFDHDPDDIIIEKCRDMGITWLVLYLFVWYWLFRPSSQFLISTYREDDVDTQGALSTLFPKLRFIVENLPEWMIPSGFDMTKHGSYMKLMNPANGSIIIGSAPVPNYGRSGRFKAILLDEHAQWQFGTPAWESAQHSTKIRISLSTPWGRDNQSARLALDPKNIRMAFKPATEEIA